MSNGITPEGPPNDDPASLGWSLGESWATSRAGTDELERLTRVEYERDPHLLRLLLESDAAILALAGIVMPPCAMHLDSARAYWRCLLGSDCDSFQDDVPFIAGFLGGAIEGAQARARSAVIEAAYIWLHCVASPLQLNNVEAFVHEHGDTWDSVLPVGCNDAFDLCYFMETGAAPPEEEIDDDEQSNDSIREFLESAASERPWVVPDEQFAAEFINLVVVMVQHAVAGGRPLTEVIAEENLESDGPEPPPSGSLAGDAAEDTGSVSDRKPSRSDGRQLRHIRIRPNPSKKGSG